MYPVCAECIKWKFKCFLLIWVRSISIRVCMWFVCGGGKITEQMDILLLLLVRVWPKCYETTTSQQQHILYILCATQKWLTNEIDNHSYIHTNISMVRVKCVIKSIPIHEIIGNFIEWHNVFASGWRLQHHMLNLCTKIIPFFAMPIEINE